MTPTRNNPYPNIYAYIKEDIEALGLESSPSSFSEVQQQLSETPAAPSTSHPLEFHPDPEENLFEKAIPIQFSAKELNYLEEVASAFNFTSDISVFDWVHYHGYCILSSIPNLEQDIITEYLALFVEKTLEQKRKKSANLDETTLTERDQYYRTLMLNEKYIPTEQYNKESCLLLVSKLRKVKKKLGKSKSKTASESSKTIQDKIKKIEINISVINKFSQLDILDFIYLRFKKSASLYQSNEKTRFWNELIDYIDYLGKAFQSIHLRKLVLFDPIKYFSALKASVIDNRNLPSVDQKIRQLLLFKSSLFNSFKELTDDFIEDIELVKADELTHSQWALKNRIHITVPKSPYDLASTINVEVCFHQIITSSISVILNYYIDSLRRAQALTLSSEFKLALTFAVINHFMEDQPVPTEPVVPIENIAHHKGYEQLKNILALLRNLVATKPFKNVDKKVYDFFEKNLRKSTIHEKFTLFNGFGIIDMQLLPQYAKIASMKKNLITQLSALLLFLKNQSKENPEDNLQPLVLSIFHLIFAHTHTLHKILAIDIFTKIKLVPPNDDNPIASHLFSLDEIDMFLLVDDEMNELLTELRSYLPIPPAEDFVEDENSESSNESVDFEPQIENSSPATVVETPIASCSRDISEPIIPEPRTLRKPKSLKVIRQPALPMSSSTHSPAAAVETEENHDLAALKQLGKRNVKGRKLRSMLKKLGYIAVRQKGTHITYSKGNSTATVPRHNIMKTGTMGSIHKQAEI